MRIDGPLATIGEAVLAIIPDENAWTPAEFLTKTKQHTEEMAVQMDAESRKVTVILSRSK